VVHDLLVHHYDPIYLQSMRRNFAGSLEPRLHVAWDGTAQALKAAADRMLSAP
jgi:tRNA 2-selenouridine synthase